DVLGLVRAERYDVSGVEAVQHSVLIRFPDAADDVILGATPRSVHRDTTRLVCPVRHRDRVEAHLAGEHRVVAMHARDGWIALEERRRVPEEGGSGETWIRKVRNVE